MGPYPIFIIVLVIIATAWDTLLDVDYEWWRKWIGEQPRRVGDPPNEE